MIMKKILSFLLMVLFVHGAYAQYWNLTGNSNATSANFLGTTNKSFVKENRHLPDIPSEKELRETGLDLAEMDGLLLKKIEEMTLYVIELEKEVKALRSEVKRGGE